MVMTRGELAAYLGECRQLAVDEIRRMVGDTDPRSAPFYDLMMEYPLRGAKGLRPALCLATCRALGGGLEAALPSAAVIELFHNAFLIHDDVEDGSERRRERATLHLDHGMPIAVNVADGMLALALQPLLDNTRVVGLGKALRILQVIARMARESAEGQAIELAWIREGRWDLGDDDYRHMVLKKTGWYSFIAPMTIGAIVAGADDARLEALQAAARELAIAFQVRDDLLNLSEEAEGYGKEAAGDLWEGKRTLILLHALRRLGAPERAQAMAILARRRPDASDARWRTLLDELAAAGELSEGARRRLDEARAPAAKRAEDVAQLRRWIDAHDAVAHAAALGRAHAEAARVALRQALDGSPGSRHRDLLGALIDYTVDRER